MAPYNYNTYYDPVGNQSNQPPAGYTYASATGIGPARSQYPSQNASYGTNYSQNYSSDYTNQQYGAAAQQPGTNSAVPPSALDSVGRQNYGPTSTSGNTNSASQYDNSSWGSNNYSSTVYNASNTVSRSQASASPLYATQSSDATFGRSSVPDQAQTSQSSRFCNSQTISPVSTSAHASAKTYRDAPSTAGQKHAYELHKTQQQQRPPRYASPLHAVQAQQHQLEHRRQSSRTSNNQPSPQMTARSSSHVNQHQNQQSASVEPPAPTTVDPSQVYDFRAEQEKRARLEDERRRRMEAEAAVKRAEEDAKLAAEEARKAEVEKVKREQREEGEVARQANQAEEKKKATQAGKQEQRRQARKEQKQSKTAAAALQQLASSATSSAMKATPTGTEPSEPPADDEAEMRAMFKKMREFNAKNPAMLAMLWEEERRQHSQQAAALQQPQPRSAAPIVPAKSPAKAQVNKQPKALTAAVQSVAPQPAAYISKTPSQVHYTATSLWPSDKKGSLAEVASLWLGALHENLTMGRTIGKEQILNILDTNPSYAQLCESIENAGIKFERSALAKELLKAVPDVVRGHNAQKTNDQGPGPITSVGGAASNSPANTAKKRGGPKTGEPPRYSSPGDQRSRLSSATTSYSIPTFPSNVSASLHSPQPTGGPVQPSASLGFPDLTCVTTDATSPPQPVQLEVKPEAAPVEPEKPPADKEEAARKRTFGALVDLTKDDSDDEFPVPKKMFIPSFGPSNNSAPVVTPALPSHATLNGPMSLDQFVQQQRNNNVAAQSPAADPARPPFVGKPPVQGPPAPPAQVKPKGPTEEHKQAERMRGKMLVEPIMRDRVTRKSRYDSTTIARDVLLATGRHPDMRPLNGHLNGMQKLLGDHGGAIDSGGNKSDLGTVRWDIIDPGAPVEDSNAKSKTARENEVDHGSEADDESEREMPSQSKRGVERGPAPKPVGNRVASTRPSPRHRRASIASGGPAKSPSSMASGRLVGYSAFRQYDSNGNVVKKKGRPVGWRKNLHSREALGLVPAPVSGNKHPKLRNTATNDEVVESHYQIFKCRFKDCGAELDNLEHLKKHVLKIHGISNDDGDVECTWLNCLESGLHVDAHGKRSSGNKDVASFETHEQWLKHVNHAHLADVAWKQGDGPRGGSVSDQYTDSESYLSDAHGRAVTPVIRPRANRETDKILSKDEREASAEIQKLKNQKRREGPSMGLEGSRLVNEKRRRGFLDDEDFEDIIEDSEPEPYF